MTFKVHCQRTMESQSHSKDYGITANQLHVKDCQNILTELQGQIKLVSHQMTMMNQCLEKVNRALGSTHSIGGKTIVDYQEENALLRKQLTDFQHSHMELLADRRRRTLENYKSTYEAAHAISKSGKIVCDSSNPDDCEEVIDEVD